MTTPPLTGRETQVLTYIRGYMGQRGYPPTLRETGEACGLDSASSVKYVLERLAAKGYITREPGKQRAITIHGLAAGPGRDRSAGDGQALAARELLAEAGRQRERAKSFTAAAQAAGDQADAAVAEACRILDGAPADGGQALDGGP